MLALFFEGCAYHERCDYFWAGTLKSLLVYHTSGISKEKSNLDINLGSVLYSENTQKGRFVQEKNIFLALTLPLTLLQGHRQDS